MDIVYITTKFYEDNKSLEEIIPPKGNGNDRPYFFLSFTYKNNNIFVPLRSILPDGKKNIGYSVPSVSKPKAGLDYRKIIITNDLKYIERKKYVPIAPTQEKIIRLSIKQIETEVISYIKGYENSYKKGRTKRDYEYIYSSLCNYHKELDLE